MGILRLGLRGDALFPVGPAAGTWNREDDLHRVIATCLTRHFRKALVPINNLENRP